MIRALPVLALLAACGDDERRVTQPAPVWTFEHSIGLAASLLTHGQGFAIAIGQAKEEPHYVTKAIGPLTGRTLTYTVRGITSAANGSTTPNYELVAIQQSSRLSGSP